MYKLHLILKYLRKRRIAWVSLVAVMLCTAMVLVVISVMGGWLRMFRESFHGLSGDVLVSGQSLSGFPHYEEMLEEIRKLPEVEAAVPTIQTFGLINVNNAIRKGVQVIGFPIADIGKVNKFPRSLHRQHLRYVEKADDPKRDLTDEERIDLRAQAERGAANPSFALHDEVPYEQILPKARNVRDWPGMIVGVGVVGIHKDEKGELYRPSGLYEAWAKLTVLGVSDESSSFDLGDKAERNYWIVDDSRTQVWQYDSNTVYVPFDALQKDLGMTASKATNRDGKEILIPARASNLQIKVRPGVNHVEVRDKVAAIVQGVFADHDLDAARFVDVETWEQSQYVWLKAIEKEVVLVTGLFGLISVVAVFLIFCIFYMIVVEKTKDIGIIKSVGATSAGVAGIFLGYGLTIGIVGSAAGWAVSYFIVKYINELHDWLGRAMNVQIWDPQVYAFDTIPNTMDPWTAGKIIAVAVVSSVVGALVPAVRAARMNPVEALRWE